MNFTTIKLDKTTLPEDGQWVEFANAVMSCGEIEDVSDIEYNGK